MTGGASGIGYQIAKSFRDSGARVTIVDKAAPIKGDEKTRYEGMNYERLDITDHIAVDSYFRRQEYPFRILVNNAAITSGNDHFAIMQTNCQATVHVTTRFIRDLGLDEARASEDRAGNFGHVCDKGIVFITSVHTAFAFPDDAAYDASKHWAVGWMMALAVRYASQGLRVNAVAPGSIEPERVDDKSILIGNTLGPRIPLGRQGKAEEVANAVLFLASPHASYITGTELRVDGGLSVKNPLF